MTERFADIIGLIRKEVKPALGCTEPIAVALAVAKAVEIVDQTGAAYTHLIPEGEFGIYILGSGATQYVPSTYFVDSEGKIVGDPVVGAMDKEKWQEEIENRLVEVGE